MAVDFPRKLQRQSVSSATRSAFASYPWTQAYLSSAALIPIQAPAPTTSSASNAFVSQVLNPSAGSSSPNSRSAISAVQHFYLPRPPKALPSLTPYTPRPDKPDTFGQLWSLYLLGAGAEGGQPGIAHGGCVAAILDEQASSLMRAWAPAGFEGMVFCNVRYHGSIRVPGPVLVKAWKARVEGRKVWVEVSVEDDEERLLVRGEVLFVNDERGGSKL